MGTTTFSGPIKAGTISNTTGTTVGTDMKNVGQVVMGQSASFDYGDTSATSTSIIIPANSQIVSIDVNVQVAFNGSGTDLIDIGVVGNPDLYIDGLSVASPEPFPMEIVVVFEAVNNDSIISVTPII